MQQVYANLSSISQLPLCSHHYDNTLCTNIPKIKHIWGHIWAGKNISLIDSYRRTYMQQRGIWSMDKMTSHHMMLLIIHVIDTCLFHTNVCNKHVSRAWKSNYTLILWYMKTYLWPKYLHTALMSLDNKWLIMAVNCSGKAHNEYEWVCIRDLTTRMAHWVHFVVLMYLYGAHHTQ